jgi:hypothetical protein
LALILFLGIAIVLIYANLSLPNGGGDFYVEWVASRGFLFEKVDPYSSQIPAKVQELVYGKSAIVGDEIYILDVPFHILLLYFPFALLSDAETARAIFTLILELTLFGLVYFTLHLTSSEIPLWLSVLLFIFCILNFYTFQAILNANPVLLLGFIYALMLFALYTDQDELLGGLFAISLYYWEVGLLFLLLIAYRCYKENRTRVFAGFFMLSFVLFIISILLYPNWILPYLRAGVNNMRADFGFTIFNTLQIVFPSFGRTLAWIVVTVFIVAYGYEWSKTDETDFRRFYWTCCLALAISPLIGFRTEMEHLAILIIPLVLIISVVYDRWRIGNALTIFFLIILFAFPWLMYFFQPIAITSEILFLFLPVFTLIGLYWIRWWVIRPPRVWADQITNRQS